VPGGGGYVQDALRHDADHLRDWVTQGAIVRVCGGRAMAQGVTEALDAVLAPLSISVSQLKAKERYAEDVF
jgi:sulfite reductase (NADPH) flavoprotein alpha-component